MAKNKKTKQKEQRLSLAKRALPALIGVLFLIVTAAFVLKPKTAEQQLRENLIKQPDNQKLFLELTGRLIKQGEIEHADRALLIAKQKFPESDQWQILLQEKKYQDPVELKKLIDNWEKIVEQKPDYRDGFLKLAFFYHQLSDQSKAKENLKKAEMLDPNYPALEQLEQLINQ